MQEWKTELSQGMARVRRMRALLRDALVARGTPGSWDHITQQIGMFSYTGLTEAQSRAMVDLHHVYMLQSGRINVAGLNEATVAIAADAIHAVITAPAL
jgi:aspartate aminotransferase, cytoplasmic